MYEKTFYLISIAFALNACVSAPIEEDISFAQVDPFMKIFRESVFFPEYSAPVEVAAGEHAVFQFAIRGEKPIKKMTVTLSDFKSEDEILSGKAKYGFIDYVKVGRTTPDRARDVLTPLSQYYPDPIIEKEQWEVGRNLAQPIWVSVSIPSETKAGNYKATFTLTGESGGRTFKFNRELEIKVYPVVMNQPDLWVTNWFTLSKGNMKIFNSGKDVELYSDEYWDMVRELAAKMKECYQNVVLISPFEHLNFTEENGTYTIDYTHFDKLIDIFHEAGVLKRLEIGHIANRYDKWKSPFAVFVPEETDGKMVVKKFLIESEKAVNFLKQFIPSLYQHVKEKYPQTQYVLHIADEPIAENVGSYIKIAKMVKNLCPDIKLIEACLSEDLQNVLDIWVPRLDSFKDNYHFYMDRQKEGNEVWFYTCCEPQDNFANRFIELPSIKARLVHWLNMRYGATGYLHWGFNFWLNENPYDETTFVSTEQGVQFPGGDSWLVYPHNGKLYSSIRLEFMRDGIADYTLLKMLEKKKPELAKELCRLVIYKWDLYDTESNHFRAIRHQILEELSTNE